MIGTKSGTRSTLRSAFLRAGGACFAGMRCIKMHRIPPHCAAPRGIALVREI
jgi:hypothetical protein